MSPEARSRPSAPLLELRNVTRAFGGLVAVRGDLRGAGPHSRRGVAILLVEQNVQQSLRLADRAYGLEHGQTVAHGPAADLLDAPELRRAYLGLE